MYKVLFPALLWSLMGCGAPAPGEEIGESAQDLNVGNVSFRASGNRWISAQNNGGGAVNATATSVGAWENFTIEDINGGSLQSGDSVYIRAGNGQLFQAANGGGSSLNAGSNSRGAWETFKPIIAGRVEIKKAGEQVLKIRPRDEKTWKAINLNSVKLTAVQP